MKRHIIYLVCICLPLVASSNEKTRSSAITHDNCQILIYSNFSKLNDRSGSHVEYPLDVKAKVESIFSEMGYHPVTGRKSPNAMQFNIESAFGKEELKTSGSTYLCWYLNVAITDAEDKPVYNKQYRTCRNPEQLALGLKHIEERKYYAERIYYDAVYDQKSYSLDSSQPTDFLMSNAIGSVLLGADQSIRENYENIPGDIGLLKHIPYCCTPNDDSMKCAMLRESNKN